MTKSFIDSIGIERVTEMFAEAARKSIAETHAQGRPVTGAVNGVICRVYPDGRIEPITTPPTDGHGLGADEATPTPSP